VPVGNGKWVNDAIGFYCSILANNPESSVYVCSAILHGLVRQGQSLVVQRILRDAVRENYALDAVCYSIVLHAHIVEEACRLFDQMKSSGMASNICAYNVILCGLCKARDMDAVKQLLTEMECFDVALDSTSFNSVFVLLSKSRCTLLKLSDKCFI
jgi:pentatricopeptide repeat protein